MKVTLRFRDRPSLIIMRGEQPNNSNKYLFLDINSQIHDILSMYSCIVFFLDWNRPILRGIKNLSETCVYRLILLVVQFYQHGFSVEFLFHTIFFNEVFTWIQNAFHSIIKVKIIKPNFNKKIFEDWWK